MGVSREKCFFSTHKAMLFPKTFGLERWIPWVSICSCASPGPLSAVQELVLCQTVTWDTCGTGSGEDSGSSITSYTNPQPSVSGTCGHGAGGGI